MLRCSENDAMSVFVARSTATPPAPLTRAPLFLGLSASPGEAGVEAGLGRATDHRDAEWGNGWCAGRLSTVLPIMLDDDIRVHTLCNISEVWSGLSMTRDGRGLGH